MDWSQMIRNYTKRDLIYPQKDRLRAFQGITDRTEQLQDVKILYGHRTDDIIASLMWWPEPSSSPLRLHETPFWSWASVYAPIRCNSEIVTAWMRLATYIAPIPSNERGNQKYLAFIGRLVRVSMEESPPTDHSSNRACLVGISPWSIHATFDVESELKKFRSTRSPLWLFPTCPGFSNRAGSDVEYWVLVVTNGTNGTFRRVGSAIASSGVYREKFEGGALKGFSFEDLTPWLEAFQAASPRLVVLS